MVNKEKALKQELIRLRRNQNPQQLDFRKMRKVRIAKAKLRNLKRKAVAPTIEAPVEEAKEKEAKPEKKPKKKEKEPELEVIETKPKSEKKTKPEKKPKKKKKEKEPELEVIEDTPESEEISNDLEDLYTYDEDIDEKDAE